MARPVARRARPACARVHGHGDVRDRRHGARPAARRAGPLRAQRGALIQIHDRTALAEALNRLPTGEAASEVATALGLNRKTLYRRALELQGK